MIDYFHKLLRSGENSIYAKIKKFEILKVLIIAEDEKYFKNMIYMLKNISETECYDNIDQFYTKIEKFSEILKQDQIYSLSFLEILGEENIKNMKILLNGDDNDSIKPKLKEKYIEIIGDYINIIVKKYKINEEKILENIEKILNNSKEKEEIKEKEKIDNKVKEEEKESEELNEEEEKKFNQINNYVKTLNEYEQLYYDLLIQTILEKPDSTSNLKSWATPIFKTIKKIIGAGIGTYFSSLTGSKVLTAMTGTIGALNVINYIKDEYIKKKYFNDDNFRKLYHINQKNSAEKRSTIIKRKIKEIFKKVSIPIKNYLTSFLDKKILNLEEKKKIGFERNLKNILNESKEFKESIINYYISKNKKEINLNFYQKLGNIKKQKSIRKKNFNNILIQKINNFYDTKRAIIEQIAKNKNNKLKEDYPEFKEETFYETQKRRVYNIYSTIWGCCSGVRDYLFGVDRNKEDNQLRAAMLENIRSKKYFKEIKVINKDKNKDLNNILYDEVKTICDENIFSLLEESKINEIERLDILNMNLKNNFNEMEMKGNKKNEIINLNEILENQETDDDDDLWLLNYYQ